MCVMPNASLHDTPLPLPSSGVQVVVEKSGLSWQGGATQEDVGVPWNERHPGEP